MLLHLGQNFSIRRARLVVQQRDRAENHPRRAIPALEGALGEECLLHRVQFIAVR